MPGQMCGGASQVKPATPEIQKLCDQIRSAAEEKAGKNFEHFQAVSFCDQVVNGTNHFVKIDVGGGECIHARIHQKLPCYGGEVSLSDIQTSKTHEDKLGYF